MYTIESPITLGIAIFALVIAIYSERKADKAWREVNEAIDKADEEARQIGIPRGHYDWRKSKRKSATIAYWAIGITVVLIALLSLGIILNLKAIQ